MTRRSFFSLLTAALGALAFWRKKVLVYTYHEPSWPEPNSITLPEPITGVVKLEGRPYWLTEHGVYTLDDGGKCLNLGSRKP